MVVHVLHHRNLLLETNVLARNEMTTTYTGCFAIDSGSGRREFRVRGSYDGPSYHAADQSICRKRVQVPIKHVPIAVRVNGL
jgi:hypothetical protein